MWHPTWTELTPDWFLVQRCHKWGVNGLFTGFSSFITVQCESKVLSWKCKQTLRSWSPVNWIHQTVRCEYNLNQPFFKKKSRSLFHKKWNKKLINNYQYHLIWNIFIVIHFSAISSNLNKYHFTYIVLGQEELSAIATSNFTSTSFVSHTTI